MEVKVTFPDGTVKAYHVTVRRGMTIEDIAREVAEQMADEFERRRGRLKNREGWIDSVLRWLAPQILESIMNKLGW